MTVVGCNVNRSSDSLDNCLLCIRCALSGNVNKLNTSSYVKKSKILTQNILKYVTRKKNHAGLASIDASIKDQI